MNASLAVQIKYCPTEWAGLLDNAVEEVFQLMIGSGVKQAPVPAARKSPDHTAMVGMAGLLCGMLSVRCPSDTATLIASRMLAIDCELAAAQSRDALGEVCNMVAGAFKNQVKELQNHCLLSVPTVVSGSNYELQSLARGDYIRRDYLFEEMPLTVVLQTQS
jgi:chemotaxis protein CheX